MKCYDFAVFSNIWILKVVLGYKKLSKTAENGDFQRTIVELSNDMSDVFIAFLEMKCDTLTAICTTIASWWNESAIFYDFSYVEKRLLTAIW